MCRGEIVSRAKEIEDEIEAGKSDKPFKTILYCNIGNPQQLGQHPVTYFRQVLALCDYPEVRHLLMMLFVHRGFIFVSTRLNAVGSLSITKCLQLITSLATKDVSIDVWQSLIMGWQRLAQCPLCVLVSNQEQLCLQQDLPFIQFSVYSFRAPDCSQMRWPLCSSLSLVRRRASSPQM